MNEAIVRSIPMSRIRAIHEARDGKWFDHENMSFFKSRTGQQGVMVTVDGVSTYWFVSSEVGHTNRRMYTIRVMSEGGYIKTYSKYMDFTSRDRAWRVIRRSCLTNPFITTEE